MYNIVETDASQVLRVEGTLKGEERPPKVLWSILVTRDINFTFIALNKKFSNDVKKKMQ
jgi:hypothetical protein